MRQTKGNASIGQMSHSLLVAGAATLLLCCPVVRATPAGQNRTNFVIVLCDDVGYGDLGSFGHPTIKTPNLDQFAAEGMRLTDCYAAAPVCSPARAGMLTGRNPNRCGIFEWIGQNSPMFLGTEEITVAELLKSVGYATCHIGKWHCNEHFHRPGQLTPGDHGFDHWFSTAYNSAQLNPGSFVRNGKRVGPLTGYSSALIVDEAISWLKGVKQDQPFCLFVWLHATHEPIATPKEFTSMYPDVTEEGKALYYGNVTQIDHEFGRLIKALDETNRRDNTFVMLTSDNGPETLNRYKGTWRSYGSAGPLRGMKVHLYEGGIRVPGIIQWPGRTRPGTVCAEPISGTDVLPTLCAIAGVDIPSDRPIDGSSMAPIFKGKPIERKVPLFWYYYHAMGEPKIAMRQGDWKILAHCAPLEPGKRTWRFHLEHLDIIRKAKPTKFEMYNLREDIGETRNLAETEPRRLKHMSSELIRLHREVVDESLSWPGWVKNMKNKNQEHKNQQ